MNRQENIDHIADRSIVWDVIVVGGGATGLGAAVDAASRGYRTLLLEQGDFAQGTSSRSTKLIHGGVRYLQQGNLALVLESLHERGLLLANAPHLVRHLAFVVPIYEWWEGPFYGIGLKLYDALAGKLGLGPSRRLSRKKTLEKIPTLEPDGLRGGVVYYDGQFDDARLAISLLRTLEDLGGNAVNYMPVTGFLKTGGLLCGAMTRDEETGRVFEISGRAVINAAGIFIDSVCRMDDSTARPMMAPSQGVHIVLDKGFLPGSSAIMVPHTDDGRLLFAVPWHDRVIIGTTDTPVAGPQVEPQPFPEEVEFLLSHAGRYLTGHPSRADVKSVFAGIRPLINSRGHNVTASLSRDHRVLVSASGLVTVAGGKWTTYRKMGEDAVTMAARVGGLDLKKSCTDTLELHGRPGQAIHDQAFSIYGTDADAMRQLIKKDPELDFLLHPQLPYRRVEIVWAVRNEMARTVTDVLARRLRALILDAKISIRVAPIVASIMAKELVKDLTWESDQVASFEKIAKRYMIN
ncbi:glycerol-3-phosphate dehydrogenase/oxidase [Desulfobacula toluolica]|uniref:GlpD: glycerol-3-phosphate dehydrogenase n=1 Tax=Desulfobacula toluolica (strain DSM 7467 / Tol2) TaxID=651182 RepID=K0N2W4_DESTT|nr:glycerol-3-phosphate dehydrogenase/oxidase [Desulfobacula toluolica]CCK78464.1 GlpD: glycerol-3-phosphate dehydrogenase [Desulfobacula toluolica Tol2]